MSETTRFDIRVREYTPAGVRGKVIKDSGIEVTGPFSNPSSLRFKVSQLVAKRLMSQPIVVAFEYSVDGGAWVEPNNGRFVASSDSRDMVDESGLVEFQGQLFGWWLLTKTYLGWSSGAVNGERSWTSTTAGAMMHAFINESIARGWGNGSPVTFGRSFNATIDSNGVAWPTAAADRISTSHQILTPLSEILSSLVAGGMCDFDFTGTTLNLYRAGTGTDHTIPANGLVRLNKGVTSAPVRSDFNEVFTHLTVVPEKARNYLYLTNTGAPSTFGRLEATMSQSGVKDHVTATKLAQPALELGRASRREFSITYAADAAKFLPWAHYKQGDLIQAKSTGGWENLRVVEIVVQKDADGVVEVTAVLSYRFRTLITRLASRTAAASMGSFSGGTGVPIPGGSVPPLLDPAIPTGVIATSTGQWDTFGNPRSSLTVSWSAVTQDVDSALIDVNLYEVWSRTAGGVSKLLASTSGTSITVDDLDPAANLFVKVRARSAGGTWSEFTAETEVDLLEPTTVLLAPTTPVVTQKLGVVSVKWDGNLAGPTTPPATFRRVYVTMATTSGGTYTATGQIMGNAGSVTVADIPKGATRWFKLVAVDSRGVASPPSAAASVTVGGVTGPDLEANSVTANIIAAGAVEVQHLSIGAKPTSGAPTDRVPSPLTDDDYWGKFIAGTLDLFPSSAATLATAGPTGVTLAPTVGIDAWLPITAMHPIPTTGSITTTVVATIAPRIFVREFDVAGAQVALTEAFSGLGHTFSPTTVEYRVELERAMGLGSTLVQSARVFEAIGSFSADQQGVVIDPSGIRLTSADGGAVINLTTNDDQFISVQRDVGAGVLETQASMDSDGVVQAQTFVSNNDFNVLGQDVVGGFADALINGEKREGALLDRVGWGTVMTADCGGISGVVAGTYQRFGIGSGTVELSADRIYEIALNWNAYGYFSSASASGAVEVEVYVSSAPMTIGSPTSTNGTYHTHRFLLSQQALGDASMSEAINVPPFTPAVSGTYYVMVAFRNYSTRSWTIYTPWSRLSVRDVGPATFSWDVGDWMYRGTTSAPGTPGSTGSKARTNYYAASWSRSWASGGGSIVSGSSQYSNAQSLYQGYHSSYGNQGAMFGFPALGLSGRTITSCQLYLQNRFFYNNTGGQARFGTSTVTSAPASHSTTNNWTVFWRKGAAAWFNVPSSLWASIASGSIRAFTLGINGGRDYFGYWDGVGQASPPRLRITSR